jgi:hypothetical protein
MKDLDKLQKILGIKVDCDRKQGITTMPQGVYIQKILTWHSMQDVKPVDIPLLKGAKFISAQGSLINPLGYAQAIRLLIYAALGMWPDIVFAIQ